MDASPQDHLREFLTIANALLDSRATGLHADPASMFKYARFKIYMRKYNQLVEALSETTRVDTIVDHYNLDLVPGSHDTTLIHQKELFDSVHANLSILKAYLENKPGLKEDRIQSLTHFFQANLRKAIFSVPEKEVDVQNAVEQLFIGRGFEKRWASATPQPFAIQALLGVGPVPESPQRRLD